MRKFLVYTTLFAIAHLITAMTIFLLSDILVSFYFDNPTIDKPFYYYILNFLVSVLMFPIVYINHPIIYEFDIPFAILNSLLWGIVLTGIFVMIKKKLAGFKISDFFKRKE